MILIGIDPGLDGAIAILGASVNPAYVHDTPTMTVMTNTGKRRRVYDIPCLAGYLEEFRGVAGVRALIENVHAMPGQGVRSMFSMGFGLGLWEGLLGGLRIPFERVAPRRWKGAMLDGQGKEKDASRFKAQALFPTVELHLKKHHGRADALLIAEFGRRLHADT